MSYTPSEPTSSMSWDCCDPTHAEKCAALAVCRGRQGLVSDEHAVIIRKAKAIAEKRLKGGDQDVVKFAVIVMRMLAELGRETGQAQTLFLSSSGNENKTDGVVQCFEAFLDYQKAPVVHARGRVFTIVRGRTCEFRFESEVKQAHTTLDEPEDERKRDRFCSKLKKSVDYAGRIFGRSR